MEGLPVYGVAVPTVIGLRIVLDIVGADQGRVIKEIVLALP